MNRVETLVEKKIKEAMEQGEFDNLPGKGEPLNLAENPFESPDMRLVNRLLRNAGFAPAWIEEGKQIEAEFARTRAKLERARALFGNSGDVIGRSDWQRSLAEFRLHVEELNERVKFYNLKAPSVVFHRRLIVAEQVIEQIEEDTQQRPQESGR